ncbi:MAG: hypothetical protein CM1200mP10_08720 [Candidatus Neomarinimicrobiota bacterium]|nr:MAG: hypothetical protein CM1200mP10_08720 [Candidatus Neomarinimicrobiota bacterium]
MGRRFPRGIRIETEEENLWRYASVLPSNITKKKISLGEGWTPLLPIGNNVYVKNETVNPTGSFKDRGMAMAVTMAKAQNLKKFVYHLRVMRAYPLLPIAKQQGLIVLYFCRKQYRKTL